MHHQCVIIILLIILIHLMIRLRIIIVIKIYIFYDMFMYSPGECFFSPKMGEDGSLVCNGTDSTTMIGGHTCSIGYEQAVRICLVTGSKALTAYAPIVIAVAREDVFLLI